MNKEDILQANKEATETMEKAKTAKRLNESKKTKEEAHDKLYGNNAKARGNPSKEAPECFKAFLGKLSKR